MTASIARRIAVALVAIVAAKGFAADFSGDYVAVDDPSLGLSLKVDADGRVTGALSDDGDLMPLSGQLEDAVVTGAFGDGEEVMTFTARSTGDQLVLDVIAPEFQDRLEFVRTGGAPAAMAPSDAVMINGQRLDAAALARAEKEYGIRIPPGDYWYDRVLGAWGATGGPDLWLHFARARSRRSAAGRRVRRRHDDFRQRPRVASL